MAVFLATCSQTLASEAYSKTYIVDRNHPNTSDRNDGTDDSPFATITAAVKLVQPGERVLIKKGVYREYVGVPRSGTPKQPIVIEAEQTGEVIISGADVLSGWQSVDDHDRRNIAWVNWDVDFIVNRRKEDDRIVYIRSHGAPMPIGCAELVIWQGRPLVQVMAVDDLLPATFFVDWELNRLYVCLPADLKHESTLLEGGTRNRLFEPLHRRSEAHHVHVKGLVFRHAPGFAQRPPVVTDSYWVMEDCRIEWNESSGIKVAGDGVRLIRCRSMHNGFAGIGGLECRDVVLRDCETSNNNRKGFKPSWEGGGGKWLKTNGLKIINHTAHSNGGPGIWLDWDNTDFEIQGCRVFGNYGVSAAWEGVGIFVEANAGPGLISNNVVYSNTGAGIGIAESQSIVAANNLLADNGTGIELRAMEGRGEHRNLMRVDLRNNRFKSWRDAAIGLSLGDWPEDWPNFKTDPNQ